MKQREPQRSGRHITLAAAQLGALCLMEKHISNIEHEILEDLSYDWECLSSLDFTIEPNREEVVNALETLLNQGYIQLHNDVEFDRQNLMSEPNEYWDTKYWFGLTPEGNAFLESYEKQHCSENMRDWSKVWSASLDFESESGYVEAPSIEVCTSAYKQLNIRNDYFKITANSEKNSKTASINPTYYKVIPGGHRIEFKLTKIKEPPGSWIAVKNKQFGFLEA